MTTSTIEINCQNKNGFTVFYDLHFVERNGIKEVQNIYSHIVLYDKHSKSVSYRTFVIHFKKVIQELEKL